jgi:hypothetical protein
MDCFIIILCLLVFIFALILGIIGSEVCNSNITKTRTKEEFLITPQGAKIDATTGALKGVGMITDGMLHNTSWNDIEKNVNTLGVAYDGRNTLGVGITDNKLDVMYKNHQDILDLDKQAEHGVRSREEINEISKRLVSGANNANNNLYTRGGLYPTKMYIAHNEIRGVINEEFLPERDKKRTLEVVNDIIHIPGFDIRPERIGVDLDDTHFSSVIRNKDGRKRLASAAGALSITSSKDVDPDLTEESPNLTNVERKVRKEGNNIIFAREGPGANAQTEIIAAPVNINNDEEDFRANYAMGNTAVRKKRT